MSNANSKSMKFIALFAMVFVLAALLFGIGLAGKTAYAESNKEVTTRVAHISDSHVMPMSLCNEYSDTFASKSVTSAKLMLQSEAALCTALNEMYLMKDAPEILLLSGDITSNGEYAANVRVAEILTDFMKKMRTKPGYEKFQVFIVPGNHDTYNQKAVTYMPTKEELEACESDEERMELMKNYPAKSTITTTSKDIFEIYSDFGYCDCPGRKAGHHTGDCLIAEGTVINYFYESDFWYDKENKPTRENGVYTGFDVRTPTSAETEGFKNNGKDFEYLAEAGKIGICSYVATLNGVTVVGIDGNARNYEEKWKDKTSKYTALKSADGWYETTGGLTTRAQLRWIVEETRDEVEDGNLMLITCHYNNIPHFEAQDEIISLFVLDNLELYNSTLSEAGFRYSFSGHQHAMDVADYVTQSGNVFYDIETSSLISYGSGYRIVDFKQTWENGDYSEDVKTTVHSLKANNESGTFDYAAYKLRNALGTATPITQDVVNPDMFTLPNVNLYDGTDYLVLAKEPLLNKKGEPTTIGNYLTEVQYKMLDGMVGNFLKDDIFDELAAKVTEKMKNYNFTSALLSSLLSNVSGLDFLKVNVAEDGSSFTMSTGPVENNGIIDAGKALASYFLNYDYSYGTREGGTSIADLFVDVYGGHLVGAQTKELSDLVKPLMEKLYDGTFVRYLIDTLVNSIVPELDYLFNLPIRFNEATPELAGNGIDITEAMKTPSSSGFSGLVDTIIKNILTTEMFKTTDENGYYSVKFLLKDLLNIVDDLLITPPEEIESEALRSLARLGIVKPLLSSIGNVEKYITLGKRYVAEYLEDGSLYNVLKKELLDKYVTDAFCKNLGDYAAYLIGGVSADDTPDGSYWGEGNKFETYTVVNPENVNVTTEKYDASSVFGGKAYVRKANGTGKLTVPKTAETGLTASMISVAFNEDATTTKKIKWFTSVDSDIMEKKADGTYYEYGEKVPENFIKYSLNKDDVDKATPVKATSKNRDIELPTIDLGIAYFNMSHRYKLYNEHEVKLDKLQPGKTYYYKLGNDAYGWTETYSFATASKGSFTFMAMTDIQGSVEQNYIDSNVNMTTALKHFADEKTDIAFIASMGDNVDNGKSILQYTWWLDDQRDVWANNTLVTLAGNHEKKGYSLSNAVAVPDNAVLQDTGFYYSYDYGAAHFIVIDTNDLTKDNELSEQQTDWLIEDLEENEKAKWTIVMLHKGPYTAGSHAFDDDVIALRKQLTPIFADYGVDLVLQGHDHTYTVSEYIGNDGKPTKAGKGVLYINLGTMGDKFYNYIYSDEVSIKKANKKLDEKLQKYVTEDGYLELKETPVFADIKVDGNKITVKAYTVVDNENVLIEKITIGNALSVGAIVGIAVGGAAVVAGAAVGVVFLLKKKKVSVPKKAA